MIDITINDYEGNKLSPQLLDLAFKKKWFKIFIPAIHGGLESSLKDGVLELIEAATIHGGLGWVTNLGSGAGFFCRNFDRENAERIFGKKDAVVAGSGKIGSAKSAEGGYIVSGNWDRASGSAHAKWISANVKDEEGEVFSVLIPKDVVQFQDSWNAYGLSTTSSWEFSVTDVFIPFDNCFKINDVKHSVNYPLYAIEFEDFARFCMIASAIGMHKCLNNHLKVLVSELEINKNNILEKHQSFISSNQKTITPLANAYWDKLSNSKPIHSDLKAELVDTAVRIGKNSFDLANELLYEFGLLLSNKDSIAYRAYLDLILCTQHSMIKRKEL